MTDLEITKLCAEAMGLPVLETFEGWKPPVQGIDCERSGKTPFRYDPLHDDAQAMALVRWLIARGVLTISAFGLDFVDRVKFEKIIIPWRNNADEIRRAICECVAKMQAPKK